MVFNIKWLHALIKGFICRLLPFLQHTYNKRSVNNEIFQKFRSISLSLSTSSLYHSDADQDLTGVTGVLAFNEVLVCLPALSSKRLLTATHLLFPLASGLILEQDFIGNPFPLSFFDSLILMLTFKQDGRAIEPFQKDGNNDESFPEGRIVSPTVPEGWKGYFQLPTDDETLLIGRKWLDPSRRLESWRTTSRR